MPDKIYRPNLVFDQVDHFESDDEVIFSNFKTYNLYHISQRFTIYFCELADWVSYRLIYA